LFLIPKQTIFQGKALRLSAGSGGRPHQGIVTYFLDIKGQGILFHHLAL
jgi:hypothetical protein